MGRRLHGTNGWLIDGQPASSDQDAVDAADAEALYALLEDEVVPAFYERDARGLPRRWLAMVKQAIYTVTPRFSARRMLKDYVRARLRAGDRDATGRRHEPI